MSPEVIGFELLLIGVMMLISRIIRVKWRLAQKLFIPSSIIGGALALLIGPDVFGRIAAAMGIERFTESGLFTPQVLDVWKTLPGLLISLVFAGLLMGHKLPPPREAFRIAGPGPAHFRLTTPTPATTRRGPDSDALATHRGAHHR
ncbi:hypothetical protein OHA40_30850 [Nocardia sp. NBC_00508]|uniref:hypothetical protein n=1 Tax=Nocardia sp. NBC_00508 TaxID=2975992 RepID=UPI002E807EB2|nr:hypothetical protein [Nocardia sp. NBC_00508]WUD65931.1 hypothetical protein OHA40_30850 [Nocardia sp. NBC_00508]